MPNKSNDQALELSESIIQDFHLDSDNELVSIRHMDDLRHKLEKIVAYLLDNDFERLLNAMYRLDIDEEKFKKAVSGTDGKNISREIAELIVSREIQKLKTRIKYSRP